MSERINGILKKEDAQALRFIKQEVRIYNTRRPHMSLKNKISAEVLGLSLFCGPCNYAAAASF